MSDRRNVWSEEAIAELRRLWDEGLTARAIGLELGFGKNSVISKSHRLHLPSRPSPLNGGKPRTRRTPEQVAARAAPKPVPVIIARDVAPVVVPPPPPVRAPVWGCAWLEGERPTWRRCDAPVWRGTSWCRAHYRRCHQRWPMQVAA